MRYAKLDRRPSSTKIDQNSQVGKNISLVAVGSNTFKAVYWREDNFGFKMSPCLPADSDFGKKPGVT